MKKIVFIISAIIISLLFIFLYLFPPTAIIALDNKIRDDFFLIRGPIKTTNSVVIIDIDEKSLSKLGQWPWSRDIMAKILENLTKAGAGIIGLDIFFPEKDTKSPSYFVKKFHIVTNQKIIDTDKIFANVIANTPTILGYLFNFENNLTKNVLPNIPGIFIEKNLKKFFLLQAKGYISNIPILQNSSYSGGFVNMIPDVDGVVRYVPLVIKYDGMIYPALSFEMFRLATGIKKIIINYSDAGVDNIELTKKFKIPTDRFGRIFVNYRGDKKSFPYISASDIYFNTFDKKLVNGKFVIIGTSAAGLFDLRVTPFNNVYPGVEVHANIIDNLLKGDFIYKPDFAEILNITIIVTLTVNIAFFFYFLSATLSMLFVFIIILIYLYATYYVLFHQGYIINIAIPILLVIILSIILTSINYLFESKKSKKLKKAFAKKVSPSVMEELLKNPSDDILLPKDKEITIFFSDVRSFTSISEKLGDPKNVIEMLNIYMTPMVDIIVKHEGTVDKFIGDAIMSYWNAPADVKNHADKAVSSAIEQIKHLKNVNEIIRKKFNVTIDIGIGINTGIATVGEMGSIGRADYTVIGDSVNLASRLEGLNKTYHTHIIISEFTKEKLTKDYILRDLDLVRVKGKSEAIKIYQVIDYGTYTFEKYDEALYLYRNSEFIKAKKIFEELYNKEKDLLYNLYIKRCEHFITNPPKNFDGVWTFTTR